jgi:integrase
MEKKKNASFDHTKFLSDDERKHLESLIEKYRSEDVRNILILELALRTGIRAQEILNLRKEDLLVKQKAIFVRALKGGKNREMPLETKLMQRLKKWADAQPSEALFDIGYRQLVNVWETYRPVKKKFHCLRHTFAIWLYRRTKDLRMVQMALGHRDYKNTMIYLDYVNSTSELRSAIIGK